MGANVTRWMAEWVAGLTLDGVPAEVAERAKLITADITGIALRGRNDSESTPPLVRAVTALGLAGGDFRVIGETGRYSAIGATMINATAAHSLEMDDTFSARGTHNSCIVVPAALAAAQMTGASGKELLLGIVAGLETMCRVALGAGGRSKRGFHLTPTTGAFGATAAASKILGLNADEVENAFGIVLSQTSGNMQFHINGAWTKRTQIGAASAAGVTAAAMAREGMTGPTEALEGERGFYNLFIGENAQPGLVASADGWQIMDIAFKPHSSCRGTHAAIDAAIGLRNEHSIDFDKIELVSVGLPRQPMDLIDLLAAPNKLDPHTHVEGQFSINFCVATGLRLGRLGVDDYETQFWDPEVRDLMARTSVFEDPEAKMLHGGSAAASLRVKMRDGAEYYQLVNIPKGEPDNMLTRDEARAKFDALVVPYIGAKGATRLYETVMALDEAASVDAYFDAATP